jgi:hypothetical protein
LLNTNLLALPVIDESGVILGIITVDDAMEILLPKGLATASTDVYLVEIRVSMVVALAGGLMEKQIQKKFLFSIGCSQAGNTYKKVLSLRDGDPPNGRTTSSSSSCRTPFNAAWGLRCTPHRRAPQTPAPADLHPRSREWSPHNAGNDAGGHRDLRVARRGVWLLTSLAVDSNHNLARRCSGDVRPHGRRHGKGLADLIRERFGVRWTAVVMMHC